MTLKICQCCVPATRILWLIDPSNIHGPRVPVPMCEQCANLVVKRAVSLADKKADAVLAAAVAHADAE